MMEVEGGSGLSSEEVLVCVELYLLQFPKQSPEEAYQLRHLLEKGNRFGMIGNSLDEKASKLRLLLEKGKNFGIRKPVEENGKLEIGACGESGAVEVQGGRNVQERNVSGKRKRPALSFPRPVVPVPPPEPDSYVAPRVPTIEGLSGLMIRECSKPFEKQLTVSDLKDDQSRLSFRRHDAQTFLLPFLRGMNLKAGLSATVYDMEGRSYPMTFKNWCDKYYVLTSGWRKFYKSHDLKAVDDFVTVWMFRHGETNELCFALSIRRREAGHLVKRVEKLV